MTGLSPRGRGLLALTFGTLLSSQGAGAHRSKPLGLSRGNLLNVTRLVSRCQTRRFPRPTRPIPVGHGVTRGPEEWVPSGSVEIHRRSGRGLR